MANIAGKEVGNNDLMVIGGGGLLFILSFFHWRGTHGCATEGGHKSCVDADALAANAWGAGFLSWAGMFLVVIAAVIVALRLFTAVRLPQLPLGESMLVLALAALGTLFILLRLIFGYHADEFGVSASISRGIGLYLGFVAAVVTTAGAFLAFTSGGGKLSDFKDLRGGSGHDGAGGGMGYSPPAPPAV